MHTGAVQVCKFVPFWTSLLLNWVHMSIKNLKHFAMVFYVIAIRAKVYCNTMGRCYASFYHFIFILCWHVCLNVSTSPPVDCLLLSVKAWGENRGTMTAVYAAPTLGTEQRKVSPDPNCGLDKEEVTNAPEPEQSIGSGSLLSSTMLLSHPYSQSVSYTNPAALSFMDQRKKQWKSKHVPRTLERTTQPLFDEGENQISLILAPFSGCGKMPWEIPKEENPVRE